MPPPSFTTKYSTPLSSGGHLIVSIVIIIIFSITIFNILSNFTFYSDIDLYKSIGRSQRPSEYPPLVTLLFSILANPANPISFIWSWIIFYQLVVIGVILYVHFFCPQARPWHFPLVLYSCAVVLGVGITLASFDFLVLAAIYLAWQSFFHQRYGHSGAFLTLAAFIKLVPVIIWPLLWLHTPPRHRRRVLFASLAVAILLVAFIILANGVSATAANISFVRLYHNSRTIQIESTWSALHLLWQRWHGDFALIAFHHGSWHNDSLKGYITPVKILAFAALFAYLLYAFIFTKCTSENPSRSPYQGSYRRVIPLPRPAKLLGEVGIRGIKGVFRQNNTEAMPFQTGSKKSEPRALYFLRDLISILLLAFLFSPVLSPQFFVWVLPLIPLWLLQQENITRHRSGRRLLLIICVLLAATTQLVYPLLYERLLKQELSAIILLVSRQILLLALLLATHQIPHMLD